MKRHETSYFFREGIRGIFLHGFMSFAAVGVIVACLLIMGSFALLAYNLDSIIKGIQNSNEILVVVDESLSDAEARSVGTKINQLDNVSDSVFVSKEEALQDFSERVDEQYRTLIQGLEQTNPLRNRFMVRLFDVESMEDTATQLRSLTGVAEVYARLDIATELIRLRNAMNTISLVLIIILMAVSIFIISNTVKLATFDRREEIGIMRVVGATKSFIRWPFVVEGFLLGLFGAVIAFFLQWNIYTLLVRSITNGLGNISLVKTVSFGEIFLPVLAVFVLAGFLVGVGGSVLTIRKFLKV